MVNECSLIRTQHVEPVCHAVVAMRGEPRGFPLEVKRLLELHKGSAIVMPGAGLRRKRSDCMIHICFIWDHGMGIVNIDDDLHDQLRKASAVSCRSINAQAAFWIKVGMLCELNPTQSFNEIVAREMSAAGVAAPGLKMASP